MEIQRRTDGLPGSMGIMTDWSQEDIRETKKVEIRWSGYYDVYSHNNIVPPRHL